MTKAGIFMRGDIYEAWLVLEVLPKVYPELKVERQLVMNDKYKRGKREIEIQGHADIGVNGQVIEVKTIGSKTLDWLTESKIENLRQINYYTIKLKRDGLIVYLTPESLFRKEFEVKPNQDMFDKMIDRAFDIDKHLLDKTAPEPTIHWACDKANRIGKLFCEYCQKCIRDGNAPLQDLWKSKAENRYNKYRRS